MASTPVLRTRIILLVSALTVAAPARGQTSAEEATERLEFMKDSVRRYRPTLGGDRSAVLQLQEKPVFRLGKQYADNVEDGAIFLWTGDHGRPEAAVQVFQVKHTGELGGRWYHEFTSLSPSTITANRQGRAWWFPRTAGVEFKPVPDAPRPAETAAQRTRQMRSLSEDFRASDNFKEKGWSELRLLPTPILRYGASGAELLDGALFAFVLGTDPEVFLFLEARPGQEGPEWQYALAPMTVFAVKGSYRGKAVWGRPDRQPGGDPSRPFLNRAYEP
jgi:hypothetical protein